MSPFLKISLLRTKRKESHFPREAGLRFSFLSLWARMRERCVFAILSGMEDLSPERLCSQARELAFEAGEGWETSASRVRVFPAEQPSFARRHRKDTNESEKMYNSKYTSRTRASQGIFEANVEVSTLKRNDSECLYSDTRIDCGKVSGRMYVEPKSIPVVALGVAQN